MQRDKILKQMEVFDTVAQTGLTMSEYYLLASIFNYTKPITGNVSVLLKRLIQKEWVVMEKVEYGSNAIIQQKGLDLIKKIEKLFIAKKAKSALLLMDKNYKENIIKYKEMFPKLKLPSGKAARSAYGNLEKNFRWFFENHDFTWDDIFKATAMYINEHQKNNWKYMRTSQYFIRKDNLSDLADMCDNIKNDGYKEKEHIIKTKVV